MVGTLATLAIIASIVMVSVPAEEEKTNETDCGCDCNSPPTEGKPLNFYDVLEKTRGWEQDVALLEKEIQNKREELLELYKKTKEGILWKEIEDLRAEIGKLEGEYWYKEEVLFEISVLMKYTELQLDGTLEIAKGSLPKVEDLDVAKALNAFEMTGEEKMKKESELHELVFGRSYESRYWNEMGEEYVKTPELDTNKLEKVYREIENLEEKRRQYKKKHIGLRTIQKMKRDLSRGSSILTIYCSEDDCPLKIPHLKDYWWYSFGNFQKVRVWVGMYSTTVPNVNYMIGEYCTATFTTNMTYYWNRAKNKNSGTKSIEIKWFYLADHGSTTYNVIWQGRKNSSREWYSYGRYTTTNPQFGTYQIDCFEDHHACCVYTWYNCDWCNTHCGGCFACDPSGSQNFSKTNTQT